MNTETNKTSFPAGDLGFLQILIIYQWHDGPGLSLVSDGNGQLYVMYWTANLVEGDYVSYLLAKTSIEEAKHLEMGEVDVFNFYMDALDRFETLDYLYFPSDIPAPMLPDEKTKVNTVSVDIQLVPDLLPDPGVALDGNTFEVLVLAPLSAAIG